MPFFSSSDGLSLYYEDEGSGLPVLCLPGLTRNVRDFDFVAPQLENVRMIRMDYRGRGRSDHAADYHSYSLQREAQDALELLDHLGIDKAAILGTSRGGMIAMGLAMGTKERLLGICLNDIGPVLEGSGIEVILTYLGVQPDFPDIDAMARDRMAMMEDKFPGVPLSRWCEDVERTHVQTPDGMRLSYDPKLRDAVIESATAAPDLWPYFDAIAPLPCAVIHGANSDLLSFQTVEEMKRRNPGLIVAHVADRAHVPFLDEPEARDAIAEWLGRISKETRA